MAQSALRLRRALPTFSYFRYSLSCFPLLKPSIPPSSSQQSKQHVSSSLTSVVQSGSFRSYPTVSLSNKTYHVYKEGDEITQDTILFEGCDYNHWLIVMDFPKDPKPTPQEMVRTYEETCAKGLNISLEEAKQNIYACSTTTYQGFQAIMTEEESEKFHGLPGVVFVLPDSYIDPQNKEYGRGTNTLMEQSYQDHLLFNVILGEDSVTEIETLTDPDTISKEVQCQTRKINHGDLCKKLAGTVKPCKIIHLSRTIHRNKIIDLS